MRFVRALIGLCVVCGCGDVTDLFNGAGGANGSGGSGTAQSSSGIGGENASSSASSSSGIGGFSMAMSSSSGGIGCDPECAVGSHCDQGTCIATDVCCQAGTNVGAGDNSPPVMVDNYIAWPFVASCDMDVNQVQLFTNGGSWWIAKDDNGFVGAIVIGGSLPVVQSPDWIGQPVAQVIHLIGGTAYWVIQGAMPPPSTTTMSVAENGKSLPFRRSSSLGGPWTIGDAPTRFAVNFVGLCP